MGRTLRSTSAIRWLLLGGVVAARAAWGQGVVPPTSTSSSTGTVVDVLHDFSDQAAVIFAGQVLAIQQPRPGVVEVQFRVDQAIRGCSKGMPYVLREWAGLWAGGNQRYRVGQRLLMMLRAPGAAGMSSPVGGMDGAIPIRQGTAVGESVAQPPYVDLRWLGARTPRSVVYVHSSRIKGLTAGDEAFAGGVSAPTGVAGATGKMSSVPSQQASVDAVMGMLMGWERAQHGAP
jgi:hypothetical protein